MACAPPAGSDLAEVQNGKSRQVPGHEGLSVRPERAEGRWAGSRAENVQSCLEFLTSTGARLEEWEHSL